MGRKNKVDPLEEFSVGSGSGLTSSQYITYFVVATLVSALPAYLFNSVYDLDALPIYAGVTVASAALLTLGYGNVFVSTRNALEAASEGKKGDAAHEAAVKASNESQASNWAFFWANSIFFGLFAFLAFYALSGVELTTRYAVSVAVSSFLAWQFSSAN